jgi:hypothetical protein
MVCLTLVLSSFSFLSLLASPLLLSTNRTDQPTDRPTDRPILLLLSFHYFSRTTNPHSSSHAHTINLDQPINQSIILPTDHLVSSSSAVFLIFFYCLMMMMMNDDLLLPCGDRHRESLFDPTGLKWFESVVDDPGRTTDCRQLLLLLLLLLLLG